MAQDTELRGYVLGGKYRLVRQVSDGPRRVYEARHERLAGRFAAKLWPATTPWDAFREGAELAATLRHPGVMQVLDFNCEPGAAPFLVYEWVDGTRLTDILAEAGILPVERVAPLVESAAWALASAHQQGVVHQELRPDEVFVVHAPGTMREWVKLAGFGVSAALARAGTVPPSRYRAPEQRGRAGAEARTNLTMTRTTTATTRRAISIRSPQSRTSCSRACRRSTRSARAPSRCRSRISRPA